MTLALTLGMSVGLRKTFWMMYGELLGVGLVAVSAVAGVSALMLSYPSIFVVFKILGASYLAWVALGLWQNKGKLAIADIASEQPSVSGRSLFIQGFITAIANPKGWAFMVSLLPPVINPEQSIVVQMSLLVAIILLSEFVCMCLYASGGKGLVKYLAVSQNVRFVNRISSVLMFAVALWLLLG